MRILIAASALLFAFAALPAHAGDAAKGKDKATVCGACHGPDGNSPTPDFPRLAGQQEDYLVKALSDYKSGKRKNPIMAAQVEALSKADMADVAAWFSSQQGLVVKR
jgi:cytochrome c553